MYRSDDWFEGFYIDNHKKYECNDCGKEFIVGEELLKECPPGFPLCPYCGQSNVECTSWTEDDQLEELSSDLGCLAIQVQTGKYLESTLNCQDINDEQLEVLEKRTDEAFKKAAINIEDAFIISTGLAKSRTEIEEVICKHQVNGICELGIKTWCANCKQQKWGKYEPMEDT